MKKVFIIVTAIFVFTSCKKNNLPDPGTTSTQSLANQWWVTYTVNGVDVLGVGHVQIATYNSSANNNELWVDDLGNGASGHRFKVKTVADLNTLTFSATNAANQSYSTGSTNPQTVTITNGKVLLNAAHSRTGIVTDSIYMQANMGGTTYTISGYARTRWAEDDF
jgi:hypothetical protein